MQIKLKKQEFKFRNLSEFQPCFARVCNNISDHGFPIGTKVLCYDKIAFSYYVIGQQQSRTNSLKIDSIKVPWLLRLFRELESYFNLRCTLTAITERDLDLTYWPDPPIEARVRAYCMARLT